MIKNKQPYVSWKGPDNLISALPVDTVPVRHFDDNTCNENCKPLPKVLLQHRKQLMLPLTHRSLKTIAQIERPGGSTVMGVGNAETLCEKCGNTGIIQALTWPKDNVIRTGTIINNPETNEFGVCVSCDPENNVIKRRSLPRMQNNISLITYLQSRCKSYDQRISTQKLDNVQYINQETKEPILPSDTNNTDKFQGKGCNSVCPIIYKPNNPEFACQGAVSNGVRLTNKVHNEITANGGAYGTAWGLAAQRFGYYTDNLNSNYLVKSKPVLCKEKVFLTHNRKYYGSSGCSYTKN